MFRIYCELTQRYQDKYGPRTVVLMQVGSFYEMYTSFEETQTKETQTQNVFNSEYRNFEGIDPSIASELDLKLALKPDVPGVNNVYMAGFPLASIDRYVEKMMALDLIVVQIDQIKDYQQQLSRLNSKIIEENNRDFLLDVVQLLNPSNNAEIFRWPTAIHSPGTYLNPNHQEVNYNCIGGLLISNESTSLESRANSLELFTMSLIVLNLESGSSYCFETSNTREDYNVAMEEVYRFICAHPIRELLIVTDRVSDETYQYIDNYLGFGTGKLCQNIIRNDLNPAYSKLAYQEAFLKKVYPASQANKDGPIAYLNLSRNPNLIVSFINLLQYIYEYRTNILNGLEKPVLQYDQQFLKLDSNCIYQLEIVNPPDTNNGRYKNTSKRLSSVYNLINYTVTGPGRRLLKERLLNPILDVDQLNQRYAYIAAMQQPYSTDNNLTSKISEANFIFSEAKNLTMADFIYQLFYRLPDYTLYHHRLLKCELEPALFKVVDQGYQRFAQACEGLNPELSKLLPTNFLEQFKAYRRTYLDRLNLELASKETLAQLNDSFFNPGHYLQLDKLSQSIRNDQNLIDELAKQLSQIIDPKAYQNNNLVVKIESDKNGNQMLIITQNRFQKLKQKADLFPLKISDIGESLDNGFTLKLSDLRVVSESRGKGSKTLTINCKPLEKLSHQLLDARESLNQQLPKIYREFLAELNQNYGLLLVQITYLVAQLDLYQSQARNARINNYCRPLAVAKTNAEEPSWLEVRQLRHPLAEKANLRNIYVPHNLTLGKMKHQLIDATKSRSVEASQSSNSSQIDDLIDIINQGYLIYGVNGSGKSVLSKSVGIVVIMAQAGFFVPAEHFHFTPYQHVLCRILNNDDFRRGQSSFEVEIDELKGIIYRANQSSLVLGDEIAKGTESNSATAIVASTLIHLIEKRASFIFASHLHDLTKLPEIQALLPAMGIYHLKVRIDGSTSGAVNGNVNGGQGKNEIKIEYDRHLTPGQGEQSYGLLVAQAKGLPNLFCQKAYQIQQKLAGHSEQIQSTETSRYNNTVYRPDRCPVCKVNPPQEVNHIRPQRDADNNGYIGHIPKNHPQNLIWLCRDCHQQTEHPRDGQLLIVTSPDTWRYSPEKSKRISPKFRLKT